MKEQEDDSEQLHKKGGGGKNGEYRYFHEYSEALQWIEKNLKGYDYQEHNHCSRKSIGSRDYV